MLALIAGAGALPKAVADRQSSAPLVAPLKGFAPEGLEADPDLVWQVESFGTLLERLKARGVRQVCLCGAVDRPEVDPSRIDAATAPLIPRLQEHLAEGGDDAVLRAIMALFEEAGFEVVAAHEAAPDLLPPQGVLSRRLPPPTADEDARVGDRVSIEQGEADLGQACILSWNRIIAREDVRGTQAMLESLPPQQEVTTFYKAPKLNQDRRADLPVVGPDTVRACAAANIAGMTICAGGVMVLDLEETLALCDQLDLYFWVRRRGI